MSLEKHIQDLTQAVNMLTRSVDLNTATLAELNTENIQELSEAPQEAEKPKTAKKTAAKRAKPKVQEPVEPTDEEAKDTKMYATIIDLMSRHRDAAMVANGGNADEARDDTVKLLKTYSDDGTVLSLVKALMVDEAAGDQVMEELQGTFETAINELSTAGNSDDFEDDAVTEDDVKQALRAYAKIEGRPAAILKLQQLTDGLSQVKDIPAEKYAEVIKGLEEDLEV